jgi:hypothetical protein
LCSSWAGQMIIQFSSLGSKDDKTISSDTMLSSASPEDVAPKLLNILNPHC